MKINNSSSFRDPSGFIYTENNILFRQINLSYKPHYDHLINSGLYQKLVEQYLMIAHEERSDKKHNEQKAYQIIQPEKIPFISYPYEWCFSMWKDAALLTLQIQKIALSYNMSLKDASAFNIQFIGSHPILIDTLSFEIYEVSKPWVAYRQFVEHFLVPLSLMSYTDTRLGRLLALYIDGIPLDLAAKLLPLKARINPGLFFHIYLHARAQSQYQSSDHKTRSQGMSKQALLGLIDNLQNTIQHLSWKMPPTTWGNYYNEGISYTPVALNSKKTILGKMLADIQPTLVWDIGANTGYFSRLAPKKGTFVVSSDIDFAAVEKNYHLACSEKDTRLLPLFLDITNPTPALGWNNTERQSFLKRGPADLIMALALIHHLAIGNNLPLDMIAETLAGLTHTLILEFIPKEDPMVRKLLSRRDDIFPHYTKENFDSSFRKFFRKTMAVPIAESLRTLYYFTKNS